LQGLQGLLVHGERFGELALLPVDLLVQALHVLDQGLHVLRPPEASEVSHTVHLGAHPLYTLPIEDAELVPLLGDLCDLGPEPLIDEVGLVLLPSTG
jgi:hypothetical protein